LIVIRAETPDLLFDLFGASSILLVLRALFS